MRISDLKVNSPCFGTNILHSKTFINFIKGNPAKASEYRIYHRMLLNNGKNDTLVLNTVVDNGKHKSLDAMVYEIRDNKLFSGKYVKSNLNDTDTCYGMFCPNVVDLYERACANMSVHN